MENKITKTAESKETKSKEQLKAEMEEGVDLQGEKLGRRDKICLVNKDNEPIYMESHTDYFLNENEDHDKKAQVLGTRQERNDYLANVMEGALRGLGLLATKEDGPNDVQFCMCCCDGKEKTKEEKKNGWFSALASSHKCVLRDDKTYEEGYVPDEKWKEGCKDLAKDESCEKTCSWLDKGSESFCSY